MSSNAETDAVVVGGGPAGCLAASMLARAGWDVRLIDADRSDPDRVESIAPSARALLEYLNLAGVLTEAGARQVPLAVLNGWRPDGGESRSQSILLVQRTSFRAALRRAAVAAGASVSTGIVMGFRRRARANGIDVAFRSNGVTESVRTKAVLSAAGRGRRCGVSRTRRSSPATVALEVRAVSANLDEARMWADPQGWCFAAPTEPGFAYVLCFVDGSNAHLSAPTELARRMLQPAGGEEMAFSDPKCVAVSNASSYFCEMPVTPGCVVAGDALLALDPLTSSGVYVALLSSVRAALLLREQLEGTGSLQRATNAYLSMQRRMLKHFSESTADFYSQCTEKSQYWKIRSRPGFESQQKRRAANV